MATYFFDTSALVKRHVAGQGHLWVEAICDPSVGKTVVISEIALVEVVAAFSRMVRESPPRLTLAVRDQVIADFEVLATTEYVLVNLNRAVIQRAATLSTAQPLRAYDAVQLACALIRRDDDLVAGQPGPIFVCADVNLLAVAAAEGLAVDNPNDHP